LTGSPWLAKGVSYACHGQNPRRQNQPVEAYRAWKRARSYSSHAATKPVARLTPFEIEQKRMPGAMKGIWPDLRDEFFFDPLPEEELALWEGKCGPDEVGHG
jgi:hypothetical protein